MLIYNILKLKIPKERIIIRNMHTALIEVESANTGSSPEHQEVITTNCARFLRCK